MYLKKVEGLEETIANTKQSEGEKLSFRAEKVTRQFEALRKKLDFRILQNDILDNNYYHRIKRAKTSNVEEIKKWLFNGWNTEKILHLNKKLFEDPSNCFALQWAFPQAYYSSFSLTLAYFQAVGHQQQSHTGVLKQFSKLITEGKYPEILSFYTDGPQKEISYNNIKRWGGFGTISLDLNNEKCVDHWVAEFLASTRKVQLEDSKFNVPTYNKIGKKKVSYKIDDWRKVSDSIGPTSLMNILYRKRIKGNYAEVDVFQFEGFRSKDIYSALIYVVSCLNFVHEAYIYKALGERDFSFLVRSFNPKQQCDFLEERMELIKQMGIGKI